MSMYRILGADQKEYGPVTAEQVREWIAQGRANAQSRVRKDDSPDWRPVSEFPELAGAPGGRRAPGAPPPARVGEAEADAMAARILARDYHVDIGSCIGRSWEMLKSNFWLAVGATFLVLVVEGALGAIPFLGGFASLLLGGVFGGGLYHFFLKLIRGEGAGVGDAFAGFSLAFVPLMLAGLVSSLLTVLGLLLCILPGIYLAVAWVFSLMLVVDKGIDFWPALELSRKVVTRHWWAILGLLVVNILLCLAGVLACIVGVFVAIPLSIGAIAYAYEDIFTEDSAEGA
jgi:uncharacterized protein DUF4339